MHVFFTALLGFVAFLWVAEFVVLGRGVPTLPSVGKIAPAADADCPSISILFAARDEAEKLPGALATMLALDYPRYEVIAVDDRSADGTGAILEKAAREDARLKLVRLDSLPSGWLGKPHALQQAYERSSGEWLVFTDADVHFAPDVLRRAAALANAKNWDHMTLMCNAKMFTFGERLAMTFFGMAFMIGTRPWEASNARAAGYSGVGAFQMIRRSAYERLGTHRRLAMEVVDDMKLGKLAKEAGVRSGVGKAGDLVSVYWHAGVGNIVRGVTKNFFAATGYNSWVAAAQVAGVLLLCVLPVAALPFVHGWALVFAGIATALPIIAAAGVAWELKTPLFYALTFPIGALIFAWMLARSTIITLWRGGIEWRGTFYRLEELKRGVV
ncbi:MAG TPA: glycosyltransferase [Candidatus Acidoferrales bacterium]|nr:glycosyltransferase [Candidatus Acidoferrales bacterium]